MVGWSGFLDKMEEVGWGQGASWSPSKLVSELRNSRMLAITGQSGEVRALIVYRDNPVAREILYLATHPEWRGQGLMKQLICKLFDDGRQEVWLEVHEANTAAVCLYRVMGFVSVGRRKSYYNDGGDALLFSRVAKDC